MDLVVRSLCLQLGYLFLQHLSLQFLAVHLELVLCVGQLVVQLIHGCCLTAVLCHQIVVLAHELLVLVSLVGIKFIEPQLHLLVYFGHLVLHLLSLFFDLFATQENLIQFTL